MESEHEYKCTQHPSKDDTADSAKYVKSSSPMSISSSGMHKSCSQTPSPVHIPVLQVMERHGDVASDVIPASVFDSKPSTPTDWSAASNDSLFSIQIGNLSFSRDQFLSMSEDKFDELFKSGELRKSAELIRSRLPPLSSVDKQHNKDKLDRGKNNERTGIEHETSKDSSDKYHDQLKSEAHQSEGSGNFTVSSCQSDESGGSCPLAYPRKKKSGWTLCPSSIYSWDFCLCSWSSLWCAWPSWKSFWCALPSFESCSCGLPSCKSSCCERPSCKSCCCAWPSCCCELPSCSCESPSCDSKWPSCDCELQSCCCELPSCGCKWPSCGCEWPSCGCEWPSCSCKMPSCSCWPQSCCKLHCPSWPDFDWQCSSWSPPCCNPWNCRRKCLCGL